MCVIKTIFVFTILLHTVSISKTWQQAGLHHYAHVSGSVTLDCADPDIVESMNETNFVWRVYYFSGSKSPSVSQITKLNCPRCHIWSRSETLDEGSNKTYIQTYLRIADLQPGDAGLYTCLHFDEKTAEYTDIVRYQLKIISKNDIGTQVNVVEGEPINLTCYTGLYFPQKEFVHWKHYSQRPQRYVFLKSRIDHPYRMNTTTRKNNGDIILCYHSSADLYIKKFVLNVYFKPIVYFKNAKIQTHLNDAVILECMVEAFPWPKITWTRRGTGEVVNGSLAEYQYDTYFMQSIMRIDNVKKKDFGEYLCIAENLAGKSEVTIAVEPYYQPIKLQAAADRRARRIVDSDL